MKNIGDIINQGKEAGYSLIAKGATAFPYSNDLMHIGIIGATPFLAGKYTSQYIGRKFTKLNKLEKYSTQIGLACSALAELLWQTVIEPSSKYDNPQDIMSDYKGVLETAIGTGLGYVISKIKGKQK